VQEKDPWCPARDEAYLGVLVDDLITAGTQEPYRMFTSRAEYRLMLREDNADLRLTEKGRELGLIDDERWERFEQKREAVERELQRLRSTWVHPDKIPVAKQEQLLGKKLAREATLHDLLRRPEVRYADLQLLRDHDGAVGDPVVAEQVEIQAKYAGYIERQKDEIARQRGHEQTVLPDDIDYHAVKGLSAEVCEKLNRIRPATLGQAARISGMTPAGISLLLVYLKKRSNSRSSIRQTAV